MNPAPTPCLYATLGVAPSASSTAIRRAFRALARQFHPDVNPAPDATARFTALQNAYETLSDPARRRDYDAARTDPRSYADSPGPFSAAQPHYTWSNIAAPRTSSSARPRSTPKPAADFDSIYATFFQTRIDQLRRAPHQP